MILRNGKSFDRGLILDRGQKKTGVAIAGKIISPKGRKGFFMNQLCIIIGQSLVITLGVLLVGSVLLLPMFTDHPACVPDNK